MKFESITRARISEVLEAFTKIPTFPDLGAIQLEAWVVLFYLFLLMAAFSSSVSITWGGWGAVSIACPDPGS